MTSKERKNSCLGLKYVGTDIQSQALTLAGAENLKLVQPQEATRVDGT
jgi:hypothetical protein